MPGLDALKRIAAGNTDEQLSVLFVTGSGQKLSGRQVLALLDEADVSRLGESLMECLQDT